MKTKILIKEKAALLFNELGVINVTLREVAKQLGISYGNVTYHFASKEQLLLELYKDMNQELLNLQIEADSRTDLLTYLLKLPEINFDITLKYLFFTKDFVEIKRHFTSIYNQAQSLNIDRKTKWLAILEKLKEKGYLNQHLESKDLEYIIQLSVSVRTFYFQALDNKEYNKVTFSTYVNQLLKPYLSPKGMVVYTKIVSNT